MHITRSFVNHDYIEVTMTTSMSMSLCTCVIESDTRCKSSQQHASGKRHTHVLTILTILQPHIKTKCRCFGHSNE
jgi:hypothetical protein